MSSHPQKHDSRAPDNPTTQQPVDPSTGHPDDPTTRRRDDRAKGQPDNRTAEQPNKMRLKISAVDEELCEELVDVDANPLRELLMTGMNEAQNKRGRELALMLTMHMKNRALQMITRLSGPTNGFEIRDTFWKSGNQRIEDAIGPC